MLSGLIDVGRAEALNVFGMVVSTGVSLFVIDPYKLSVGELPLSVGQYQGLNL